MGLEDWMPFIFSFQEMKKFVRSMFEKRFNSTVFLRVHDKIIVKKELVQIAMATGINIQETISYSHGLDQLIMNYQVIQHTKV